MKEERKGELFILGEALLWALFPIIAFMTFSGLPPVTSLSWTTLIAAVFFGVMMFVKGSWRELKNPLLWRYGLLIAFFIGVCFYGLYYAGLKFTTPGNAGLIALFEVLTSYVLFNVLRKEPFPLEHKIGAGCMVLGAVIILGKSYGGFVFGDLFILAATFFAPFGNMFSQKCREIASSETILFLRSFFSGCALLGIAVILGEHTVMDKAFSVLPVLLLNGVVIFGVSKLFWLEGIHRMPVTKAIIMQSMTPLLTLLFAWFLLSQAPTVWQLSSVVPLLLGVILLTGQFRIKKIRNPFDKKPLLEP